MKDCKPVKTPMDPSTPLSKKQEPQSNEEKKEMENVPYLIAVGALNYLAITTRPDISYTVGVLARFNTNPGPAHWKAVKHLFRYLKGTMDLKLTYSPTSSNDFETFVDADHGGDKDSGKSTTGYALRVGSGVTSWSSKRQSIVALSTTEAEYVAATSAGAESIWMEQLLDELGYPMTNAPTLHMDNQSALSVAKNPEHHGRMKHLDLRFFWLQEAIDTEQLQVQYLPTSDMPADILTKALPRVLVEQHRQSLGLI
jgi:hypothetical protein